MVYQWAVVESISMTQCGENRDSTNAKALLVSDYMHYKSDYKVKREIRVHSAKGSNTAVLL